MKPGRYECHGEGPLPGVGDMLGKQLSILRYLNNRYLVKTERCQISEYFSAQLLVLLNTPTKLA